MAVQKKTATSAKTLSTGLVNQIAQKSLSRVRQDVASWNTALTMARKAEKPKRHLLYNLYDEILIDGLLRSQLSNRFLKSLATTFSTAFSPFSTISTIYFFDSINFLIKILLASLSSTIKIFFFQF